MVVFIQSSTAPRSALHWVADKFVCNILRALLFTRPLRCITSSGGVGGGFPRVASHSYLKPPPVYCRGSSQIGPEERIDIGGCDAVLIIIARLRSGITSRPNCGRDRAEMGHAFSSMCVNGD